MILNADEGAKKLIKEEKLINADKSDEDHNSMPNLPSAPLNTSTKDATSSKKPKKKKSQVPMPDLSSSDSKSDSNDS